MRRLLFAKEMQAADARTIAAGVPSLVLMERAALSVLQVLKACGWPLDEVCIIAGSGNNGGDGIALARLLAEEGRRPKILFAGEPKKASSECAAQLEALKLYDVEFVEDYDARRDTVVVDALFGVGLSRPVSGDLAALIERVNAGNSKVLSVDIPSGISADTGQVLGCAVRADVTVCFAFAKPGLYLYPGTSNCGEIKICPIGIPEHAAADGSEKLYAPEAADLEALPPRDESGNKGSFGKVLVIAGSKDVYGAAYLAAAAALRSGAGMVRIFTEEHNRAALCATLPEALFSFYNADEDETELLLDALKWADVTLAGPGLGTGEQAERILSTLRSYDNQICILDADAINLMAGRAELLKSFAKEVVITPHIAEMSRISGKSVSEIKLDPIASARSFAGEYGVCCVQKDARSVTAYPDGSCYLNTSGNSALATAGSGDVLAGLVAGFYAQYGRFEDSDLPLAALAVYRHGSLGERASKTRGKAAVKAGDLLEELARSNDASNACNP